MTRKDITEKIVSFLNETKKPPKQKQHKLYVNGTRTTRAYMRRRAQAENTFKGVLRGVLLFGVLGVLFYSIISYIANKWVLEASAEVDIKTHLISQYEWNVLQKRCYKKQIERVDQNKPVNKLFCEQEENLMKFRQAKPIGIQKAAEFIEKFEGFHPKAYWDYKQWSIGYGTKSYKGETITKEEAEKRLIENVKSRREKTEGLEENQRIGLTSFLYNAGNVSNILAYARKGDNRSVIYIMNKTVYAGGKKLKGLVDRRSAEVQMYINK